ncbi:transcriptional regulator [Vibrio cholerae]
MLVTSLVELQSVAVTIPSESAFTISEKNQIVLTEDISGPAVSFALPSDRGSFKLSISSFAEGEKSVFASNVMVLDSQGDILVDKKFSDFEYYPAKYLEPNKFVLNLDFISRPNLGDLQLVVYTTKEDLKETSTITHPAKVFAKAKNVVPPNIPDLEVIHTSYGSFLLVLEENTVVNERVAQEKSYIPAINSSDYYRNAITAAVEENDIDRALVMLEEAKALNVEGAQETFIKAVNAR